ncbi:MAG: NADH-quinone oxidoreductase subunit C [Bacteroidales bacterium]
MNVIEQIRERLSEKIVSNIEEKTKKRFYLEVAKENIVEVVKVLFIDMKLRFITSSATDMEQYFEILYHFSNDKTGDIISLRTKIDKSTLQENQLSEVDSITPIITGAEWIEREIWELLGINFKGHPNLKRLLLSDDWPEGNYPLRQK